MKNETFEKLKNSIAYQSVFKIVAYSLGTILLLFLLVDVIYNDDLANSLSRNHASFYYWCVGNKSKIVVVTCFGIFVTMTFLVIRNSSNHMVKIIEAMDLILKEPEKEIKLSNDLLILESRLNNIRVDLVANQNKAREATQKKNDLIMYMAHDLKTPLTSVIGYLSLLSEEKQISKELQEKYTKIALDKAIRVEELTNQFFDITRYNLQDIPLTKQKLDLTFLLEQLVEESYPMLQERNLKCHFEKTNSIEFMGDGDKLARAFGNLLKNAIHYCLGQAGIISDELEAVVYYDNPIMTTDRFINNLKYAGKDAADLIEFSFESLFNKKMWINRAIENKLGGLGKQGKLFVIEHHISHAASAFFPSIGLSSPGPPFPSSGLMIRSTVSGALIMVYPSLGIKTTFTL